MQHLPAFLCQLLFQDIQFLFQIRQLAVLQFRCLIQIVFSLGDLDLVLCLFDLFPDLGYPVHLIFLRFPGCLHGACLLPEFCQFFGNNRKPFSGQVILFILQGSLFDLQLHDPPEDLIQLRRHGIQFRFDHGAGFIHQIDRFIRQEPVGNVPV